MPVSSTFSPSAPKSASSSEQKPPGNRRERSSTRIPASGIVTAPPPRSRAAAPPRRPAGRPHQYSSSRRAPHGLGDRQHRPRLRDRRRPAPHVLGHLPGLRDQLAVG